MALLTSTTVLSNYKDPVEIFLAVPEEEDTLSEEETLHLLLLDTGASGTPEKNTNGAHHETEHGLATRMESPAEIAPPIFENAGQPLK